MDKVCLIGGLRSYIGLTGGVYRHVPAELLGAAVLKAVTEKYNVVPQQIICGNGVGAGGNIARLAALEAGLPESIPAVSVDVQCGSGLEAVPAGLKAHLPSRGAVTTPITPIIRAKKLTAWPSSCRAFTAKR